MNEISSQTWRLLVESVEDYAIFMLDPSGRVLTWSRGAQKNKGYTAEEIIGKHFSIFYSREDQEADKPGRELRVAKAEGRVEDEGWRLRKDGSRFWANVVITALRDAQGQLVGYAKVTRDLTERRAGEESLRRSEERLRLLVESVSDYAIYMLGPNGEVTTWNAGAQKLKGYAAEEIIGQHYSVFFPPEDVQAGKPRRELEIAASIGRFEEEGFRVRKGGSRFWANVVLTPIRDAHGQLLGYAKVTRDLTERVAAEQTARELIREQAARVVAEAAEVRLRESEQRYRDAAQRAEEANRVKDEFLGIVSHELRTPLNAILGWSSILRTRNLEPTLARALEVIHRNALAQGKIIDDILDVSRIIAGKLRLSPRAADLSAIVRDALEVVRPSAAAKGISIEFLSDPDCLLVADPERLQQVVWNLLSNAVKFSQSDGRIIVRVQRDGSRLELTVQDTGQGIDREFLPFVFDRFKQADSSSARRVGGLGLGLAIVRHLVELHGGSVAAESPGPGQGATFSVRLPVRAVAPPVEHASEPPQGTLEPRSGAVPKRMLGGKRVLVVDDEPDARELLLTVLTEAGATVETASSAAEGFAVLQRFRPHVLVSDIGMPGEDGYAFVRRVKALAPSAGGGIPSLALTAYTRAQDKNRAISMGFTTHMGKPVNPDDLVSAVANLAAFVRG